MRHLHGSKEVDWWVVIKEALFAGSYLETQVTWGVVMRQPTLQAFDYLRHLYGGKEVDWWVVIKKALFAGSYLETQVTRDGCRAPTHPTGV